MPPKTHHTHITSDAATQPVSPAAAPTSPPPDPFVQLSIDTSNGLSDAIRELSWIVNGGDATASAEDITLANLKLIEYDRERTRVHQRLVAFLSKKLSINPPSAGDVARASQIATQLAGYATVNVTVSAIVNAAGAILDIYNKA